MKTLTKEILSALKVETKLDLGIFSELSFPKQEMMFNKLALIDEIEHGFITNEETVKKCIQLIELMYEWTVDNPCNVKHELMFNDGTIELHSSGQGRLGKWIADYKDGELYLNGEKFDGSIPNLLNFIEAELLIHHV